jgi:alpha-aminoadipate carrier protein LysW
MPACPVCEADVPVPADAVVHELVDCGDCATELEIASLAPPSLREAPVEEEDWGE